MGFSAEYEITCPGLPLAEVAAAVPEALLELEFQPSDEWYTAFVVQAIDGSTQSIENAFEQAAFVRGYTRVRAAEGVPRYRIEPAYSMQAQLEDHVDDIAQLQALAATDSVIDTIRVTPTGWIQGGWFADRATLGKFWSFWRHNGGFTLRRLTLDHESSNPSTGLTERQRRALSAAYEMGHFEIPRSASLAEVAAELDISASSLSERLRRAQTHLIETTAIASGRSV